MTITDDINNEYYNKNNNHYFASLVTGGFGGLLPSRSVSRVFINSVSVWEYYNKRKQYISQPFSRKYGHCDTRALLNWEYVCNLPCNFVPAQVAQ